jgi:heme A synthase
VEAVYRVWAVIVAAAVVVQIGFAGYGAFYVANKVDDAPVNDDTFMDGWGLHAGFGYLVVLLALLFVLVALAARVGRPRVLRTLGLFGLMVLQVLLAWFGFEIPFIGIFHPINAFLILGLSGSIAYQAWRGTPRVQPAVEPGLTSG